MTYNMSFTEGNTITGLFTGVNTASDGLMGGVLLVAIFIIVVISTRTDDFKVRMTVASFISTIIGGVMFGLGWITQLMLIICVFTLLISGFVLIWSKE